MLDGKLLISFIKQIAQEHHLHIEAEKLRKAQVDMEYYDPYGFDIFGAFPTMEEINVIIKDEEEKINPEWEQPHDKWPRDYDNSRKETDEC